MATTQTTSAPVKRTTKVKFERRLEQPRWLRYASPVILIIAALLVGALLAAAWSGPTPGMSTARWRPSPLASLYGWSDTTIKATPLILAGLGVAVAFRMRLWNIGAEGQLLIGAFMAAGVALHWLPPGLSQWVVLFVMAVAGFVGGAFWGFIPGILKAKLNINEIITTLMLTYVAFQWNNYFVYGPWSERGFGLTPQFPKTAWMPRFTDFAASFPAFRGVTAHMGIFLAIGLCRDLLVCLAVHQVGL